MLQKTHLIAGTLAFLSIACFLTATLLVEIFGTREAIAAVKRLIVLPGLLILIPCIAAAGGTGFALSKSRKGRITERKKRRMRIIAANGILILVPAAVVLSTWASAGIFDTRFHILQLVEILAGTANLSLMGLNFRDGFRLRRPV